MTTAVQARRVLPVESEQIFRVACRRCRSGFAASRTVLRLVSVRIGDSTTPNRLHPVFSLRLLQRRIHHATLEGDCQRRRHGVGTKVVVCGMHLRSSRKAVLSDRENPRTYVDSRFMCRIL